MIYLPICPTDITSSAEESILAKSFSSSLKLIVSITGTLVCLETYD